MKTLAVVLSLMICAPASAEELTASLLYSTCLDKEYLPSQQLCRFYILGAVQGLEYGDEAVRNDQGVFVERKKTHFCLPPSFPQAQMVAVFMSAMERLKASYAKDLESPAVPLIDAAMTNAFPCPK